MNEERNEYQERLMGALQDIIDYYIQEYNFTYVDILGVLEGLKYNLILEYNILEDDEDEE
jgi:hypothetical protein